MKIREIFESKKQVISFEIFPPKFGTPLEKIDETVSQFAELKPDFMSVTYGAGGSQKDMTVEIASLVKNKYNIECLAHFTSVGHSKEEIDDILNVMKTSNIKNILALRGDPPRNQPDFDFSKNIYTYASEFIEDLKTKGNFCLGAAAYPEAHINCKRIKDDLYNLKNKVDKGVDFLITQLFFDNRIFFDFMDRISEMGIKCPVTPGIMPVFKANQIKTITELCGSSLPAKLVNMIDKYRDNEEDLRKAGIEYASNQIRELLDNGVDGVHIITMNRPKSTRQIMENVGLVGLSGAENYIQ